MRNMIIILNLLFSAAVVTQAQETQTQVKSPKSYWELEADPVAYALNGFSVHAVRVQDRMRFDLGVFGLQVPESFNANKGFEVYSRGAGLKVNYLLNSKETWFAGAGFGYLNNTIRQRESSLTQVQHTIGTGVHVGYRIYLFRNFNYGKIYLTPWISMDYNKALKPVQFNGETYKTVPLSFFPTVHIGYRFK